MKFLKRNTQAQQREAIAQGRSLSPYRLRYTTKANKTKKGIRKKNLAQLHRPRGKK
ncbi:MAG: hypothetical protein LBJ00_13090 [Planctomycetaceae bacterium]|nr:hypothetical protein [Planctomycetaceae bacterium]